MAFRRALVPVLNAAGLLASGAIGAAALQKGLWGLLAGAVLAAIWLGALHCWRVLRPPPVAGPAAPSLEVGHAIVLRVLLDAAPTPLLGIEGVTVRALNRAARQHFVADDRILPVPAELLDRGTSHLRHEGRSWRIDRVDVTDVGAGHVVVALIDIEQEQRVAEARATAELIHVLGHELLNGLAPIVSLAESGLAAVGMANREPTLLPEILGTLARRAEGLQRFTEAYRTLARLPEPSLRPVLVRELAEDLARLFVGRWPSVALSVNLPDNLSWTFDRDQVSQAIWALLQNATEAASADPDRSAQVLLRARGTKAGLEIEVGDNGDGVPADSVDRIFRPFHSTKPDGTGIGLSLARQIAHAHGGTLAFEPAPITVFRLVLPEH